jgi:class 3 adenylate cyclase/tetratricopeptide (TPR) repeat protein
MMKRSLYQTENQVLLPCYRCGSINLPQNKYCGSCGIQLDRTAGPEWKAGKSVQERKYLTILFSDLSGYTDLSTRLDPEELKEIMNQIFGEIARVIISYEGFIEKFVGDAVMAFFGLPKAHEDDPVRAILAARNIHHAVAQLEGKIGHRLSMHSGISTGLVITGEVNLKHGTHGISGDTINLASRLEGLAPVGEIVVDQVTYQQAEGYFTFESLRPASIKGKPEPIKAYRVLAPKNRPRKVHRLHGLRAQLIGRQRELSRLQKAAEQILQGKGSIISIRGDAGTGKSRLVEEFKQSLPSPKLTWREGHAFAYAKNIPYFLFRDLLQDIFHLQETDSLATLKEKIESGTASLCIGSGQVVPYLGNLFGISYPRLSNLDPEVLKSRLQKAIKKILEAIAIRTPTVLCMEDLHWGDPTSLELLKDIMANPHYPALFICTFRPSFSLAEGGKLNTPNRTHHEILLEDLTKAESQEMLQSLLKSPSIPGGLEMLIQNKIEGNPFYLEEILNSLLESKLLIKSNGNWKLLRPINKTDIPLTIHGVIAARTDRLDEGAKQVLQYASVIGRSFDLSILSNITQDEKVLTCHLDNLVSLGLIRVNTSLPEGNYDFRHALTQEVVYNSLLKKERQEIHERTGLIIEKLFSQHLSEKSEILAFHFTRGKSLFKAVEYLMQSGTKSLNRYAVVESHQYYKEAYQLLTGEDFDPDAAKGMLIQLLNSWTPVYYFRGNFRDLEKLLTQYITLAESLEDKEQCGMFYVCLGISFWAAEKFNQSYHYLQKALRNGAETGNKRITSHAYAWLGWTSAELGLPIEALYCGEKARKMSVGVNWEHYPNYHSWDSDGYAYWVLGGCSQIRTLGKTLIEHGQTISSIRCTTWGHTLNAWSSMISGDFKSAIHYNKLALKTSSDPLYTQFPRLCLGMSYVAQGDFEKAKRPLEEVLDFSRRLGCAYIGTPAQCFLSVVLVAEGKFSQGFRMLQEAQKKWEEQNAPWRYTFSALIFGELYSALAGRKVPISFVSIVKNIFFLAKNLPFARQKAENHYRKALVSAQKVGAKAMEGQAQLGLGKLYRKTGNSDKARDCFSSAVELFEECEAETFLREACEARLSVVSES